MEREIAQTRYSTVACGAIRANGCEDDNVALSRHDIERLAANGDCLVLVDVRELFEQKLGLAPKLNVPAQRQSAPLSTLVNVLPEWLARPESNIAFFCRSGNRSAQAARAVRRLGHKRAWSLDGGLALWAR